MDREEYIEISSYEQPGYQPLVDYMEWRVAILNDCEELELQNLRTMQKHEESDEVFVLLKGDCTLFLGGIGARINDITAVRMEPLKLYNIKRGVWHTHTLSKDTSVLIIENRNTCDENSPMLLLKEEEIEELRRTVHRSR